MRLRSSPKVSRTRWVASCEELASERRWEELFSGSHDLLAELADHALAEHRAGRTEKLDPDKL